MLPPTTRCPALIFWLISAIALVQLCGCANYIAEQMVRAPNYLYPRFERTDASPQRLGELFVDRQLRVPVGPPPATLSVYVCEPYSGPETIDLIGEGRNARAVIKRPPTSQPASAPTPRATIFILNGIQDHKEKGAYVLYRELLVQEGYRVIQVDSRGHGRSSGDWVTFGVVESRDMVRVLDELEKRQLIAGPVGVLGVSFGAAIAIQWAGIDPRVKTVIALEPYATIREAANDAAGFFYGPLRSLYTERDIQAALDRAGQLGGFDPDDASPLRAITQTRAPVLLIHSRADELVSYKHSQRLHEAAPDHSRLLLVDGDSHFDMWFKSRDMIRAASLAWLRVHLLNERPATLPVAAPGSPVQVRPESD